MTTPDLTRRWLAIDGEDTPDGSGVQSTNETEGRYPPFYVFDVDGQQHISGPLPTRSAGEKIISILHGAGAMLNLPFA
jgi:hypothetical protein